MTKEYVDLLSLWAEFNFELLGLEEIELLSDDLPKEVFARFVPSQDISKMCIVFNAEKESSLVDLLLSICHEIRHYYQFLNANGIIDDEDEETCQKWGYEFKNYVPSINPVENNRQSVEVDANAYASYLMREFFSVNVEPNFTGGLEFAKSLARIENDLSYSELDSICQEVFGVSLADFKSNFWKKKSEVKEYVQ